MTNPQAIPSPLLLGFALGLRHALDADHLVAMSTIVSRERSLPRAALLGGWWGIGHCLSLGAMLIGLGLATLLRRDRGGVPPPARESRRAGQPPLWMGRAAALASVAFGVYYIAQQA